MPPTGRVYTDQTGPFPVVSTQGIKATMILYDYDSNAILVEGITSQGKSELLRAYTTLLQRLVNSGTGTRTPPQRGGTSYTDVEKPFPVRIGLAQSKIPNSILELPPTTIGNHLEPTATIQNQPTTVRIRTAAWQLQLQQ